MFLTRSVLNKRLFQYGTRAMHYDAKNNVHIPESLEDIRKHHDKTRPTYMMLYFHADWNPTCEEIEDKYHKFCVDNGTWTHYKIDTDAQKRIKFFYDVKCEPSFFIFLNGMLMKRIIGYNFEHIKKNLEYTVEAHHGKFDYHDGVKDKWVDYYTQVDLQEAEVERDRDPSRQGLLFEEHL
ncbi:unnamed protein product [Moneuplotes crassus]|uniref:Thioredoxin domain-containing protein n=1 Tax=Euplotes crassus TaxID=5936 RepID=A0AAD2D1S6_EUPCR|nr:unnamed protein product [Moneuplotes crassus]